MQAGSIALKPVELLTDGLAVFQAWGHDPENFAYLTARAFSSPGDASRYLANLFPCGESRAFHVVHVAHGIIGIVKVNLQGHRATIGYVIHRPFWGNGFATAAVSQVTALIEEMPQVARIWATCALENRASARVLEKCGFECEGILRNWVTYPAQGGRPFDNYSYVRIPARLPRDINIRAYASQTDWDAVRDIYDLSKPDEMRGAVDPAAIVPFDKDAEHLALFRESVILVAEKAGHIAGFGGYKGNYISWLFVHPEHRREGVGRALLSEILRCLAGPITLNVAATNAAALELYAEMGFGIAKDFVGKFNGRDVRVLTLRRESQAG